MVDKISYIVHITTEIKERFKQHASIKKYYSTFYGINTKGQEVTIYVAVIATLIKESKSVINAQINDFNSTLKLFC